MCLSGCAGLAAALTIEDDQHSTGADVHEQDRALWCRRSDRPKHREGGQRPRWAIPSGRPIARCAGCSFRRRSARRDCHVESRRSGVRASSGGRRRRDCLPRWRELLAIRAASAPDETDTRWRDSRGRQADRSHRHRLSVWAASNEAGSRGPSARAAYLQRPHAQGPGGSAPGRACRGEDSGDCPALARLLRSRRRQELPAFRIYCGRERRCCEHDWPSRYAPRVRLRAGCRSCRRALDVYARTRTAGCGTWPEPV